MNEARGTPASTRRRSSSPEAPDPKAAKKDLPARSVSVDNNVLTFFPDGPERLDALIALIEGAKQSLRLLYYIYLPDDAGERVRAAITSKPLD